MERVKSYIEGFDEICGGGIPKGNVILVSGSCGSGKTTFAMQFAYKGALNGENSLFVSLEEDPMWLKESFMDFGWDIEKLELKKKMKIIKPELYKFDALKKIIKEYAETIKAKRVVIDTITSLNLFFERPIEIKKGILEIASLLRKLNATSIITSNIVESPVATSYLSTFGVEEFATDGVVILHYVKRENLYERYIQIRKMKRTTHSKKLHPYKITKEGMIIYSKEEMFI